MYNWLYNNIIWHFKQLFPLRYITTYYEDEKRYLTIWNMWFGKSYNIRKYQILEENK